ncbi:sugar O-acetyltransferase [Tessaracoccus caeni]|uniref:sugar O-acetyltransferase n=1 Tax=Tessaracoccus caeni TaxID=3031239 RepID=UPI0023DAB1A5|nr:sugar O-acetyltransferase [Tessaracoccus caeni]MDF1489059.1 sugar O-acetyltransferase [Tessaracoccus caeni]
MDNEQRMQAGLIYNPTVSSLADRQTEALELLYDFNATRPSEGARRSELLTQMFGSIGEDCYIEPPLRANWGGRNVYFGDGVYANFNLTLVDDGEIHVGDKVMFGPNVTISTAGHPILPELRERAAQFNLPVRIGNNVWIGAGALIMPGVTIGDNTVIGAGSVVTRDVPADVVAFGAPCRVVREIGEHDRKFYWRDREIDITVDEF